MTTFLGFGARAILGEAGTDGRVDEAGNLAAPLLAQEVGGGAGTVGGDAFLAIIAAVAFATILAVVAGLVISASGAVAHDVWSNVIRKGRDSEHEEVYVARIAAAGIGAIAIAIAIIGGDGPERLVHGRARVRGRRERQLPGPAAGADLETVQHHGRGRRRGGRRGQLGRAGADRARRAQRSDRDHPRRAAVAAGDPLGPARLPGLHPRHACSSREEAKAERGFNELHVRSETGLGAEVPIERAGLSPRRPRRPQAGAAEREPATTASGGS